MLAEEAPLRLDGNVDWNQATRWHYEPGSFRPLAKETPEGDLLYIVTDHLGTPREMVDEKGDVRWAASYTTWGLVRGIHGAVPQAANDDEVDIGWSPRGSGGGGSCATFGNLALKPVAEDSLQAYACPIRFQGQWQDEETGLYYNRHRHYDPLAGQYVSPDPIGLEGGGRSTGYVESPTYLSDPLGLRQGRRTDGTWLKPSDDPTLPAPGKALENATADAARARGDTVAGNVTIRDKNGKLVSYADNIIAKKGTNEIYVVENKGGRKGLTDGQKLVQEAIRNGIR